MDGVTFLSILGAAASLLIVIPPFSAWRERRQRTRFLKRHVDPLFNNTVQSGFTITLNKRRLLRVRFQGQPYTPKEPPRIARLLVRYFMHYKDQNALLGDLAEMRQEVLKQDGVRAANRFYYAQVVRSIVAQLRKAGLIVFISEAIRRIIQ